MSTLRNLALAAAVLAACGCESDSGTVFVSGDCKSGLDRWVDGPQLAAVPDDPYQSLMCIEYEVQPDSSVAIDIINFWGNCAGPYEGRIISNVDNAITFQTRKADCSLFATCSCPYDLSFQASGVDTSQDLELTMTEYRCPERGSGCISITNARLSLATTNKGAVCRIASGYGIGDLYRRCSPPQGTEGECPADLVCAEVPSQPSGDKYCLATCDEAADCPIPDAHECVSGLCQLADPIVRICEPPA